MHVMIAMQKVMSYTAHIALLMTVYLDVGVLLQYDFSLWRNLSEILHSGLVESISENLDSTFKTSS